MQGQGGTQSCGPRFATHQTCEGRQLVKSSNGRILILYAFLKYKLKLVTATIVGKTLNGSTDEIFFCWIIAAEPRDVQECAEHFSMATFGNQATFFS
jgi:hypothetical protein